MLKKTLNLEYHLVSLNPARSLHFRKLRCNIPPLSARYQGIDLHKRVCLLCSHNRIEVNFITLMSVLSFQISKAH